VQYTISSALPTIGSVHRCGYAVAH